GESGSGRAASIPLSYRTAHGGTEDGGPRREYNAAQAERVPSRAMIDSHIHVVRPHLPGAGALSPKLDRDAEYVATLVRSEMAAAGIDVALAMGRLEASPDDPLGVSGTLAVARLVPGLFAIGVADPLRGEANHLRRVEAELMSGRVRALKVYLGYLHFGP